MILKGRNATGIKIEIIESKEISLEIGKKLAVTFIFCQSTAQYTLRNVLHRS